MATHGGPGLSLGRATRDVTRRRVVATGGALAGGAALAACGAGGAAGEAPKAVKAKGKVLYVTNPSQPNLDVKTPSVTAFNKLDPNLQVELATPPPGDGPNEVRVRLMIASDQPPDVFDGDSGQTPLNMIRGFSRELDTFVKRDKVNLKDYYDGVIEALTWEGKLGGLSEDWDTQIMFVNRDLFQKAGLKVPDFTYTFDQWLDAAKKMSRPNEAPPVWGGHHATWGAPWQDTVRAFGGDVLSPDGKRCILNQPEAVSALQFIADVWLKHQIGPDPEVLRSANNGLPWQTHFMQGRIAQALDDAVWRATGPTSFLAMNQPSGWYVMPKPKQKTRGNSNRQEAYFMAPTAKNVDGGWAFMRWRASKEGWEARGGSVDQQPALKALAEHPKLKAQTWLTERGVLAARAEAAKTLRPAPALGHIPDLNNEISKALAPVWLGQKSARQAMDELVPVANTLLAKPIT
jgi:multiple sugar transport system substrate-binding protein